MPKKNSPPKKPGQISKRNERKTGFVKPIVESYAKKRNDLLNRRPHRSFRLTYRRDYRRSLELPNVFIFTKQVFQVIWKNKKIFASLVLVYAILSAVLVGIASQNTYSQLQQAVSDVNDNTTINLGELGQAGLLMFSAVSGNLSTDVSEAQQVYSFFLVIMTWLTTVWLLRAILTGNQPRLRDALYNAGAPIIATVIVTLIILIQCLPLALAVLIYSVIASVSGLLSMVFGIAALLLIVLSLYWVTSSFMALVIVTLPGMYPWQAIRSSGDLVVGRRIRILMRLVWLAFTVLIFWVITIIPAILFDSWLVKVVPSTSIVPVVPVVLLVVTSCVSVWVSTYVYLLYRKVVDDDASPA